LVAQWPYTVSITSSTDGTRSFPIDTSFEPYRREAFRHKTIPPQRQSIMMTNIVGEGTINTEGLWRREQTNWEQGAGQYSLDKKGDAIESRYYASKGIDVFGYPYQATLLADTLRVDNIASPNNNLTIARCGDYVVVVNGTNVYYYTPNTTGTAVSLTTCSFGTTYGGTTPTVIRSIDANETYCFLATDTGIWFCNIGHSAGGQYYTPASTFYLYAGPDTTTNFTGGYDLVRIANEQLIASRGNRLYAFQPRSSTVAPIFGVAPSTSTSPSTIVSAYDDLTSTNTWVFNTTGAHNLTVGQTFTVYGPQMGYTAYYNGTGYGPFNYSGGSITVAASEVISGTYQDGSNLSVAVGDTVNVTYTSSLSPTVYDTGVVTAVGSATLAGRTFPATVTYTSNNYVAATNLIASGGNIRTLLTDTTAPYNGLASTYVVKAVNSTTQFTATDTAATSSLTAYQNTTGGNVVPVGADDTLMTHANPSWVWSDAVGGATQVYFAGYVKGSNSSYGGCIYKAGLLGSSTTSATGVNATSNTSVFQPFTLNYPTQALPMSPDEYPTCLSSYLNFVFIGTNRGVRMAQTLSLYDPTATSTGDLKAGALIPNMLPSSIPNSPMPAVNYPVTGIVGDGRFIWFTWNNYDSSSTGLGKLDLTTFIGGDPLTPAFASDLMVSYTGPYSLSTGQGIINNLTWDSARNVPLFAIGGKGIYTANATNTTGLWKVNKYVASGSLVSPVFDYGIPEQKIPVFFDFGVANSYGSYVSATINPDPDLPAYTGSVTSGSPIVSSISSTYGLTVGMTVVSSQFPAGTTISSIGTTTVTMSANATATTTASFTVYVSTGSFTSSGLQEATLSPQARGNEFQATVTLTAGTKTTSQDTAPLLHRWTLKSWPAVVQGTNIMAVVQLYKVAVVDGLETYVDPYDNFNWLETLRQNQTIVTYQEGPLSVLAIVEELDWIPHKRQDNYENGFEGDCVVTLKTLAPYTYTTPTTV
jgi:hypothetical protein